MIGDPGALRSRRHAASSARLDWERDGADWPNRETSRFVQAGGLRWHVQVSGSGPTVLLVHGTGAATHTWRDLAPILAKRFTVVAPDLPGHGFTATAVADGASLPGMARGLNELMRALAIAPPSLGVGHSAGAAILAQMSLDAPRVLAGMVAFNGAFLPFRGVAGPILSPLAKLVARSSLIPRLFAWRATEEHVVERLLSRTGSTVDPRGVALYRRLAKNAGHVAAALDMMAGWDLKLLQYRLPKLTIPLLLIATSDDRTILPTQACHVRDLVPGAALEYVRGLGHLAHEERPQQFADSIMRFAERLRKDL